MTPRFDLSYETGQGDFYYLTAARGYRSGGIVPTLPGCGPAEFPSDTVWNYEVGTKRDLLDRRLHVDASIFHLRWDNGQQDAPESCFFGFTPGGRGDISAALHHIRVPFNAVTVQLDAVVCIIATMQPA